MQGDDEHDFIEVEGQNVTLAYLAGIDLEGIAEKRFLQFPVGSFLWEVIADPEPPKLAKVGDQGEAGWSFYLKCLAIIAVKDNSDCPNGDPNQLLGKVHREFFRLNRENVTESMGYVKAFLVDIGVPAKTGKLNEHCLNSVGLKFQCPIVHNKAKDDKDKVYSNLNKSKIIPAAKLAA